MHNPNSSRFGKFVMMHFATSGVLVGVSVKTYLLEKTRLVYHAPAERSFHALYQRCTRPDAEAAAAKYKKMMKAAELNRSNQMLASQRSQQTGGGKADAGEDGKCAAHQKVTLTPPFMVQLYSSY